MVISQCMKWGTCSYQYWKDLTWNSYGVYPQRFGEYKKHQTMCHCVPLLSDCCIPYPQYFIYEASKGKWKSINILHIYIYCIYIWFNCQQSRVSSWYYLNKQKGLKDPWHSHIVVTLASLASLATATRQANLRSKCFYWALNPAALQAPYGSSFDLGT